MYNRNLYFAFNNNHSGNQLEITGTSDGVNFTIPVTAYSNTRIYDLNEIGSSILGFDNKLIAYTASNNHYRNLPVDYSY